MRGVSHRRGILVGLAAASVLTATGVGAYAAAESLSASHPTALQQLAGGGGPRRFAPAYGLDPAQAAVVYGLRNGQPVSVVGDSRAKCLIRGSGDEAVETCDSTSAINAGQAIAVLDECGTSGRNLMEITGLAPEGVTTARLTWSDGNTQDASVTQGAFKFEGTNPPATGPYPTGISWMIGASDAGEAAFPVKGDEFCLAPS